MAVPFALRVSTADSASRRPSLKMTARATSLFEIFKFQFVEAVLNFGKPKFTVAVIWILLKLSAANTMYRCDFIARISWRIAWDLCPRAF